jgi:hypothetical protein
MVLIIQHKNLSHQLNSEYACQASSSKATKVKGNFRFEKQNGGRRKQKRILKRKLRAE